MVTFNFSITSDAADDIFSLSPISGTVTGTLELADNTAGQQPTSLIIASAPAGLDIDLIGTDIIASPPGFLALTGGIDVSGGVITSADLFIDFDDSDNDILQLFFDVDSGFALTDINALANFGPTGGSGDDVGVTGNLDGFDSLTFAAVTPNTPPVADDDSFATDFETVLSVPAATGVLDGDTDADGDPLTAVLGTGPANGTLTLNTDGSFDYTPDAGFSGTDSFTYVANDGTDDSNLATVSITVADAPNTPPVADDDSFATDFETPLSIPAATGVLDGDTDADGDPLTAVLGTGPANGTLTLNADGSFDYTPDAGFSGTDSFTYVANDGTDDSNLATVSITVADAPNTPPVADDDSFATDFETPLSIPAATGVLDGDTDADGDPLTAVLGTGPANGTLTLNADGSFDYTPDAGFSGTDSFTYVANDGTDDSNLATVTITVADAPNTPPVADDDSFATDFETPLSIPAATGVLDGDTDADGDPLTAVLGTGPANGTLTLNADGSFDYTPDAGFSGTDSFTYVANDGTDDSNLATVSIEVGEEPSDPIDNPTTDPLNPVGGTAANDGLQGTDGSDSLEGLGGNDALEGLAGDDVLDGGPGTDTATYENDPGSVNVDLSAGTATDGFGDTDTLIDIENVIGSAFGDVITGDGGVNSLTGGGGNDIINAGGGNDFVVGGAGADNLTGAGGADSFLYVSPGEAGDSIDDFEVGVDTIMIVGAVFPGGLSAGVVPASQFFDGSAATDTTQRFGYDSATGEVFFDEDGLGGTDQITLATLTNQPAFTNADITVL